jgi:Na+/proline symporter
VRALLVVLIACVIFVPSPALAYVDPGTGSILLQLLLGGLAGVAVVWKLFWSRITKALRSKGEIGPRE